MRTAVAFGILILLAAPATGQKKEQPASRYGVEADVEVYPQDTAKAVLASVMKAIDARRFGLLATIPAAVAGGIVPEVMPVPAAECDARNLPSTTIGDIITCTPLSP